jgi:hypothetical protein
MFPQATRSPNFPSAFSFQIGRVRSTMKKIIVLLAVAFALAIGTATMFVHLKPAIAETLQ